MKFLRKILFLLLLGIIFLAIALGIANYLLKSSLPVYDGKIILSGIENTVEIYRDEYAVPYIRANSDLDAAFALGFLHAQERLFQMDIMRRVGFGRLSEVLGTKTVPFDRMFKSMRFGKIAKHIYEDLEEPYKSHIEAYAAGVNSFIKEAEGNFQIEFSLLNYQPEKWLPEHTLVIGKLLAWELNISWWADIAFTSLIQKFGIEKVKEIIPSFEENAPTIVPEFITKIPSIPQGFVDTDKMFREFIGTTGTHIGSNNWVVGSQKSASGKPIIANDPHLAFQTPSKWYVVSIRSRNWDVDGFTLPGVPVIVIGKNENLSWTMTNVMADDADFYIEKLDSSRSKYLLDDEWHELRIENDSIFVKDSANIEMISKWTHRGPIISHIHPYSSINNDSLLTELEISMRWTALEFHTELAAIYDINFSENESEFKLGAEKFTAPGQNFVYADKDGNIGYVCAAKLPVRKTNSTTFIFDGTDSSNDWTGFVAFEEMPMFSNPSSGFIATANNKTVKDFKYHISNLWEPPSRIQRIYELLQQNEIHSVHDFMKYQNDVYSHYASEIVPYIIEAFDNAEINDVNLSTALALLKNWDFNFEKESQTPSIYASFYQKFIENIFLDEMGKNLFDEYIFIANIPYRKVTELLKQKYSTWFDNINTETIESKNDIVRKSLIDALVQLENKFGNDISEWQWGRIHTLTFKHLFSGQSKIADYFFDIGPFEMSGDGTTVNNMEYSFQQPFDVKLGPSMRFIYDFADPEKFYFVLPTGQSGNPFSDHYRDMTELWLKGEYLMMKHDKKKFEDSDCYKLVLLPSDD